MDNPNTLIAKALIAREFPDFDCSTLPADIPEFMIAQPWHNEACPSWRTEDGRLELWIDYADVSLREFPDSEGRFFVQTRFEGADDRFTPLYHGDDWEAAKAALLPHGLAEAFSFQIREWLSPEELTEANRLNATADASTCHSHDFCDANMAMDAAYRKTVGRDFLPQGDAEPSEADTALWNAAWDIAKRNKFGVEEHSAPTPQPPPTLAYPVHTSVEY